MRSDDVIVVTPPGGYDPSLAIAGARAGARGILDLEHASDIPAALAAIATMERFVADRFGIRIGADDRSLLDALLAERSAKWRWVVLAGGSSAPPPGTAARLREAGLDILIEAVSVAEAKEARSLGVAGLILKGQEAGGRVGSETAFVLLQHWLYDAASSEAGTPAIWVQGGIGLNTAAACLAAGATGIVLDAQLLLAREAQPSERDREWLGAFDGSATVCLGESLGEAYRFQARHGQEAIDALTVAEDRLRQSGRPAREMLEGWREAVREQRRTGLLRPLGQDACFAKPLADRFVTVSGIVQAICSRARQQVEAARRLRPLAEGAPLAARHRTRYPIVQGPMTRVSDTAPFAASVAEAGALPFLALALLRKPEVEKLLAETRDLARGRSWGVGILGFVPAEIRNEQIEAIRACPPPFALIAGGRPDQARQLEAEGIVTYLHVPSPGLLRMFLNEGSRHFVFEGRECGGHVGPRTSFVLWEQMCEILLDHVAKHGRADELQVIFAGGIHDALSAAMVSALSAGLAERGVAVGVLMGTAYLFTEEAVAGGAIVPRFQQEALGCGETVLLSTSHGHAIRCIDTPYREVFDGEKRRLQAQGTSHEEIVKALEWMNMGRLRIASKGVDRVSGNGIAAPDARKAAANASNGTAQHGLNGAAAHAKPRAGLVTLPDADQYDRGMYMIGQVAAMHHEVTSVAQLHREVSDGAQEFLEAGPEASLAAAAPASEPACDIAIIGMSCYFPKAPDVGQYWENVLGKLNAIVEIPDDYWDWRLYYDTNPRAPDKIISKWGGFLDDLAFDPLSYGITPTSLTSIDPLQLYLLESVRDALADAGYKDRPFARDRTCAMLGIGGGASPLPVSYGFRTCLPLLDAVGALGVSSQSVIDRVEKLLPSWTEDSFPGILANVAAGRVANRFDLGGTNYAIDAACGSSLAALQACIRELESGTSDVALAMAADMVQTPYAYIAFSKTHALSPRGQCRPFDATGDGIVLSEGVATVVLKRRADAERDGDKIYAVIRGIGSSSDGRAKGLTAPRAEGQLRALRRAYERAGISPSKIGLVEAHGTGTVAGDQTEAEALGQVFRDAGAEPHSCAVGSVKSMIGHTKCAAGLAGLIKTTLALHHKVLPPTLLEAPNRKCGFEDGPLYLNGEPRPWVHGAEAPRRAGVSAFGFGGTNFHVVLEEYVDAFAQGADATMQNWPAELLLWRRETRAALLAAVEQCRQALAKGATPKLGDLALSLWKADRGDAGQQTLAIVATSLEDLAEKLGAARDALAGAQPSLTDPRGIYFAENPAAASGRVAFLFPGQGSQYPNMLSQLAMVFPEVRQSFDDAERHLTGTLEMPLGRYVFPPTSFTPEQEEGARSALMRTEIAQPAVGAADLGMFHLLTKLGLTPDFLAGHSYGDYAALCAAGAIREADLPRLSHRRGKVIVEASAGTPGGMVAFDAPAEVVEALIVGTGATLANKNSPRQTVISGTEEALQAALAKAKEQKVNGQKISVSRGFHSPLVAGARAPLARALSEVEFASPRFPVFSNTTADAYPDDPSAIPGLLAEHLVAPVRFHDEIVAMHEAGARIFVEVGPQGVLSGLVRQILCDKPHIAVASDLKGRPGLLQLQHLLGQLFACGIPAKLDRLYAGRDLRRIDLASMAEVPRRPKPAPSSWIINSVRVRPIDGPEPLVLGQRRAHTAANATPASAVPASVAAASVAPAPAGPPGGVATSSPAPIAPAAAAGARLPARQMHQPSPSGQTTNGHSKRTTVPSNSNGHPNGGAMPPSADDATHVMLRYQELMSKFLDTQKTVMASYLQGGTPAGIGETPVRQQMAMAPPAARPLAMAPPPVREREMLAEPAQRPEPIASVAAPVAAVPAVAAAPAAAAPAVIGVEMNRAWFSSELVDLVVKRTGYPKEMIRLDQDLEADLGIDSIKRIEILGSMAEAMRDGAGDAPANLEMEKLASLKTLNAIVDYLAAAMAPAAPAAALEAPEAKRPAVLIHDVRPMIGVRPDLALDPRQPHHANGTNGSAMSEPGPVAVKRGLVRVVDAPPGPNTRLPLLPGVVLITNDGRGIAEELADRLADFGQQSVLVGHAGASEAPHAAYMADLTCADAVGGLLDDVRAEHGRVAGLVHLLPLARPSGMEEPMARTDREVKSLYLLARGLDAELRQAGEEADAICLAATSLGGSMGFGEQPLPTHYFAGQGGVGGFAKSLAVEWPDILVRTIDFDAEAATTSDIVGHLLAEMRIPDGVTEVGYVGSRRLTWEPVFESLPEVAETAPLLDETSTVLITGGARGITGAIAVELARRYRSTLIITGRSARPADREDADLAAAQNPAEIKACLIARHRAEGREVSLAAVEAEFNRVTIDREIRANLSAITAAGGRLEYHQIDSRDRPGMTRLFAEIEARHGGLDGVIHAAGINEDRLIRDKTPDSFDRVLRTKAESVLILRDLLKPDRLKFCVFFASTTSRYGNKGQADYGAANEILSKTALELDRSWPCRVLAVDWGPWSQIGMSASLEAYMTSRGFVLIAPEEGPGILINELLHGRKGETEIIFAGASEEAGRPVHAVRKPKTPPPTVGDNRVAGMSHA